MLASVNWIGSRATRTSISDEGLEHLQGLSRLVGLHVRGTGVTESGLEQLKQAIPGLIIRQRQPGT